MIGSLAEVRQGTSVRSAISLRVLEEEFRIGCPIKVEHEMQLSSVGRESRSERRAVNVISKRDHVLVGSEAVHQDILGSAPRICYLEPRI